MENLRIGPLRLKTNDPNGTGQFSPRMTMDHIVIRECTSISELDSCIGLQREVFGLPDLEISPRRHLIVSRQAGGWTLGAFVFQGSDEGVVGFFHHLAAVWGNEIFWYFPIMGGGP